MMCTNYPVTSLADLNYDCLREIFQHLSLVEAFATIGIFSPMVDEVAEERISVKEFHINMRFPPEYPDELFRMIGSSIKSLFFSVGYSIDTNKVLNILRPICAGAVDQSLRELSLKYIYFRDGYLECLAPIASQIEVLSLCNCQLNDHIMKSILETFRNLRHLRVYNNIDLSYEAIELARKTVPEVLHDDRTF